MFFFTKHILRLKLIFFRSMGSDRYGNTYYEHRFKRNHSNKRRRICIYYGVPESSKVPPLWHAWLHYSTDDAPVDESPFNWQKTHMPNLQGSSLAYSYKKQNTRYPYKAWKP